MRLLGFLVCIFLAGCQGAGVQPTEPAQITAGTSLDERRAIGAENAYQAAAELVIAADQAGLLNDDARRRLRAADAKAYARLQLIRSAYRAGSASSYEAAVAAAWPVIHELLGLIPSTRSNP